MQVKVLGDERRRRWNYDDKVRLVEETLQGGETVSGVARRHGVAASLCSPGGVRRATGAWAVRPWRLLFLSRSLLHPPQHRRVRRSRHLRLLGHVLGPG